MTHQVGLIYGIEDHGTWWVQGWTQRVKSNCPNWDEDELDESDHEIEILWIMEPNELTNQLNELIQPDLDFDQKLTLTKVLTLTLTLT